MKFDRTCIRVKVQLLYKYRFLRQQGIHVEMYYLEILNFNQIFKLEKERFFKIQNEFSFYKTKQSLLF